MRTANWRQRTTRRQWLGITGRPTKGMRSRSFAFELGWYYHNGRGVPDDMETAASWYRKAGDQGDARAQFNLGVMHTLGDGVPRDLAAAYIWFDLALGDTGKESYSDYGLHKGALATKRAIEGDMSPSELEEVGIAREE